MNKKYIVFDLIEQDYDFCENEEEAKKWCDECIELYRCKSSSDGWEEIQDKIGFAEIKSLCKEKEIANRNNYNSDEEWEKEGYLKKFDSIVDYVMKKI